MQICAGAAQDVALAKQRRHVASHVRQPQRLATQQQVCDTWMSRQLGHGLAVAGQLAAIECAETLQQILGLGIRGGRRNVEPHQLLRRHAPTPQLQGQPGQVRRKNLGAAVGGQLFVLVFGPQPIAHPWFQAPGSTGPLGRASPGDALGIETGHAAARIESRYAGEPGVHHYPHTVDGQARLGDVGGQHDFTLAGRRRIDGGALGSEVQFAMQRAQQHVAAVAEGIGQLLMNATDFRLPRQEHQHAAGFIVQRLEHGLHQSRLDKFPRLEWPAPAHRHREHAPFAAQDRRVVQQAGQTLAFQGRGHQQDLQRLLFAKQLPAIEAQGQRQIGVKAALVKFIENQQPNAFQCRIVLQATGEDAFGDHFNARMRPHLAVEANPVADGFTDLFPEFAGQPLGRRPCRQASGFEHEDGLPGQPGLVQQGQGNTGGFTSARGRFEHRFVALGQGLAQRG